MKTCLKRPCIKAVFGLAAVAAPLLLAAPASAQTYPWCAYYGGGFSGTNCGFSTFAQCMADVNGIGGFCQENNMYQPPGPAAGAHKRRHASY
jgi:hypothetical protein